MPGVGRKRRVFITLEPEVYDAYRAVLDDLGLTFSLYVEQYLIQSLPELTRMREGIREAIESARSTAKQVPLFSSDAEEKRLRQEVSRSVKDYLRARGKP